MGESVRRWAQFALGAFVIVHETIATDSPSVGLVLVGAILVGTEGVGTWVERVVRGREPQTAADERNEPGAPIA